MNRREVLRYTAFATGAAVCSPLLGSILSGYTVDVVDNSVDFELKFFSEMEFAEIRDLIDTILPKTDSPAATEVGVDKMIDSMVGTVYGEEDRAGYKERFTLLINYLNKESGSKEFAELEVNEKIELLQNLDRSQDDELRAARRAYLEIKQQTIAYYLSTEEIGKKYLNYLPIPGEYEACIPLSDVGGKAWAL